MGAGRARDEISQTLQDCKTLSTELGITEKSKSPFDVATSEPVRLRNELQWIDERLSKRKMQNAQSERQAIVANEQLEVISREYSTLEATLKKQVEETGKYKQMVSDMVG